MQTLLQSHPEPCQHVLVPVHAAGWWLPACPGHPHHPRSALAHSPGGTQGSSYRLCLLCDNFCPALATDFQRLLGAR